MTMEKYTLKVVVSHDGTEVILAEPIMRQSTIYDEIILDWRRQQIQERRNRKNEELNKKGVLYKLIRIIKMMIMLKPKNS